MAELRSQVLDGPGAGAGGWYDSSAQLGYGETSAAPAPSAPSYSPFTSIPAYEEDFDAEPPLLEELGIHFDHILLKAKAAVIPRGRIDAAVAGDADLAGPLLICLALGFCLLLSGKLHFGYIYGFSVFGCGCLSVVLGLMSATGGVNIWRVTSVFGYCLLPVLPLAALSIISTLTGTIGLLLALCTALWSTYSATRLYVSMLDMEQSRYLIAYPVLLLYVTFVLITIY